MASLRPQDHGRPSRIPRPTSSTALSRALPPGIKAPSGMSATDKRPTETVGQTQAVRRDMASTAHRLTGGRLIPRKSSVHQLRSARSCLPVVPLPQPKAGSAVPAVRAPTIRRVPSTNFKENFFSPAPPLPSQPARLAAVPAITRQRSQVLGPSRSVLAPSASLPGLAPDTGKARSYTAPEQTRRGSQSRETSHRTIQPVLPSCPDLPQELLATLRTSRLQNISSAAQVSALPPHIAESPWKGPRVSIEQIIDTEFSFTEDDSVDFSASPLPPKRISRRPSSSLLRPQQSTISRKASRIRLSVPGADERPAYDSLAVLETLKARDKEIELLKLELSKERQMLGKISREAADAEAGARVGFEKEKVELAKRSADDAGQKAVLAKYRAVEREAEVMQREIQAQRELMSALRERMAACGV